ncbi:MAG: hypothetical protein J7503_02490 [Cellulomonas iranensis]|jgi:hypothetical protein|uniref:Uncharacterized protein n=1 Tax=Cellulomonas iranensis TaxID=76862 RepID=A0ABU0GNU8_9CELL|nr:MULTISPECIES: hypothetical protein [Cellulomonas]MBO9567668.1 hypothetical protein [Cellulomonas iranensis]MDQ0427017.1 hypothetical protein [Cellulomonas iranensis]TFH69502.1 hypothetical protein E4A51_15740 [Cellulomonas sp. HD19AZ1]
MHDDTSWSAPGPDDDLPALPTAPLLHDDAVLDAALALIGPERAGPPALWLLLLDADARLLPVVLPLVGIPLQPVPGDVRQVMVAIDDVLRHEAPGGALVVAVVRAAGGDRGAFERTWEAAVREAADDRGVPVRVVLAVGEHRARVLRP